MDFRVFSRNISENMHARCVREDTKQALKGNLQADGVQSRQTLFVRYCHNTKQKRHTGAFSGVPFFRDRISKRYSQATMYPPILSPEAVYAPVTVAVTSLVPPTGT